MLSYRRRLIITEYGGVSTEMFIGFDLIQNENEVSYYVTDFTGNNIIKFNQNWEYLTHKSPIESPWEIKAVNGYLFVSSNNGVHKLDQDLNLVKSYNKSGGGFYRGLYYKSNDAFIYVARFNGEIDVFDVNLNFIKLTKFESTGTVVGLMLEPIVKLKVAI